MTKTRVPAIPAPTEANLREVARALKVLADIREGVTGDPLDRFVTFRDLDDGGVASVSLSGGRVSGIRPSAPIAGPGYDPTADLTTPPQPTGVTATGAFASVILSWDGPPAGYINHAYAEIWRADTNVIGESILIGTTSSTRFVDFIGNSATRYYWVRFVSQANVIGAYHGISGAVGTTSEDPELLLDALTGQITENQLYQDLGARIDLIDGSGSGSVNARIADESFARSLADVTLTGAIDAEESARIIGDDVLSTASVALASGVAVVSTMLRQETDARALADDITGAALAAAGVQAGQTAASLISESSSRIDGDVAVAATAEGAVVQAAGAVAAVTLEQQARAAADEASAQQVASLASALGDGAAALQVEQGTRAGADSALSEQTLTLAARTAETAAGLQVAQQAQADSSSALASQTTGLAAAMGENVAGLRVEQLARADADQATATQLDTLAVQGAQGSAALLQEQQARVDADASSAAQTTTLASSFGSSEAGLRVEQQSRTDADQAAASQLLTLSAAAAQGAAAVAQEQQARADQDSALASQTTTLAARVDSGDAQLSAGLVVEQQARADADGALSGQVVSLAAQAGEGLAALRAEQDVRASETGALATQTSTLAAATADAAAGLRIEQQARASADEAVATQAVSLSAATAGLEAAILTEQTVRSEGDSSTAGQVSTLASKVDVGDATNSAAIQQEQLTRATVDAAQATQTLTLATSTAGTASGLQIAQQVQADTSSALASQAADLAASLGENVAGLRTEQQARVDTDQAVASRVDTLGAATGQASAALQTVSTTQASGDSALASQVTTLQSTVGGNTVAIETEALTRASETGGLFAKYGIKIDNAGHVSGFGLLSTNNDATPTSEFGIRADKFWIAGASTASSTEPTTDLYKGRVWLDTSVTPNVTRYYTGSAWSTTPQTLPFSVLAAPGTINGVSVPAGVYIDTAFIGNATIKSAQIGSVAADTIQAGYTSSVDLESSTFFGSQLYIGGTVTYEFNDPSDSTRKTGIASVADPNIALNAEGAEFNVGFFKIKNGASSVAPFEVVDETVRIKTATIGDGTITTAKIADTIQSTNFSSTAGWQINKAGAATFNDVALRGSINGGGFTGFAWPASGQTGFHLGPNGLLLGNYNTLLPGGKRQYLQINSNGSISAPGLSISGGVATLTDVVVTRETRVAYNDDQDVNVVFNYDGGGGESPAGWYPPEIVVGFYTGYEDVATISDSRRPAFSAKAITKSGSVLFNGSGPGAAIVGKPNIRAEIIAQNDWYITSIGGPSGGRLFLRLIFSLPSDIHPSIYRFTISKIRWSILRLT